MYEVTYTINSDGEITNMEFKSPDDLSAEQIETIFIMTAETIARQGIKESGVMRGTVG